jgi:hypothetical protein
MTMYHGDTEHQDRTILLSQKPFDIHYSFEVESAGSPEQREGRDRAAKCSMESVQ